MKKIIGIIAFICVITSCYTDGDKKQLQKDCFKLSQEKAKLSDQIDLLNNKTISLKNEISNLVVEKKGLSSSREPKYIVKFKIKQGTFTLDIFEHIKNNVNSIEIELPVNRDFYNRLSIGQDLTDSFKWGSLIFDGDFSTLHMRVIGKRIER